MQDQGQESGEKRRSKSTVVPRTSAPSINLEALEVAERSDRVSRVRRIASQLRLLGPRS